MFKINSDEIKQFESDLKRMREKSFPFATRDTLNKTAFHAQKLARHDVKVKMVLRNNYAVQSIQVDRSKSLSIPRQSSTVGSIADFMEVQEFGGVKRRTGSEGVHIPTGYSAGQEGQQPRTRLPRRPNKFQNIRLKNNTRNRARSRRQRNFLLIKQAAASNNKFVFMDLGRVKGIFRIVGGKKKPRLKMVHDMSRSSVVIPRNPWLKPAVNTAAVSIPLFYRDALSFQLNRLKSIR